MVAGPQEETFGQRYHLSISLPMPEPEFLRLLHRLKLSYELVGERGTTKEIPVPAHSPALDLSKIQRCFQIYGDPGRIRKSYRAYVDRGNRVIYIENTFSYPAL
jgi:hypothetical protein